MCIERLKILKYDQDVEEVQDVEDAKVWLDCRWNVES